MAVPGLALLAACGGGSATAGDEQNAEAAPEAAARTPSASIFRTHFAFRANVVADQAYFAGSTDAGDGLHVLRADLKKGSVESLAVAHDPGAVQSAASFGNKVYFPDRDDDNNLVIRII